MIDQSTAPKQFFVSHAIDKRAKFSADFRAADAMARRPAPVKPETGSMPSHQGLGLDDPYGVEDRWKQAIENNKKPTVRVCQSGPRLQLATQDIQLVPQGCVFRLQPPHGLELRSQQGQQ